MAFLFGRGIFFQAEFDLVDTLVFVIDHHFLVAVVGVVRDVRIDSFFVGDGDVLAEIVVIDDGNRTAVRQEGQAFGFFDVPAVGA